MCFRTRGTATGLTAALNYILSFISTKTYYNLETTLSMPGVALFNCIIIACGLILMYKILPETENRTLEEIELHFADNSKKLTDRNIATIHDQHNGYEKDNNFNEIKSIAVIKSDEMLTNGFGNQRFSGDNWAIANRFFWFEIFFFL